MGIAIVRSRAVVGLDALPVAVEVHTSGGLPRTTLVGLPAAAVRESKDRVRAALQAAGFRYPDGHVTINLAPADLPKDGGRFDLPIALGILAASGQAPSTRLEEAELQGELSLNGAVRPVRGALPCSLAARCAERTLLLPPENASEAALVQGARLAPVATLLEAHDWLRGRPIPLRTPDPIREVGRRPVPDLRDVRGQSIAKRALEIAAAGGHHLLLVGPPGTGKTMLADRMPGILPPMSEAEALETAAVYSVSQQPLDLAAWKHRPMRAPHHTTSAAGLIGGSARPRPGEISLAHNGLLFLDELGEFPRQVLEALREPLESGRIVVARAAAHVEYPARFQLVAAMNPCPCGYFADGSGRCRCPPEVVRRYQARVSGPLLDRIELQLELNRFAAGRDRAPPGEPSERVRARVGAAHRCQLARRGKRNHDLDPQEVASDCRVDADGERLLGRACEQLGLSERGVAGVRRVARTIADLAACEPILTAHLAEAVALRRLDRHGSQ